MGRIFVEMVKDNIVVTRYESDGFVIPDSISQKKRVVAIIENNLDLDKEDTPLPDDRLAVPREYFLSKLLESEECQSRYGVYVKGLYSLGDMRRGITWAEVAYLLYYVGGLERSLDWRKIQPGGEYKICVLHDVSGEVKILDEKLANYKSRLDMEHYIRLMAEGSRYVPLPLYCSFMDLCNNPDTDMNIDIGMMFKKISKQELEVLLGE